ncbi:energy transducer TonB [Euzebyella marina]|uniref:Energy transducer TonB n=1 Tax=Euzebyella marina TaxID=1761453 RepID=A0A3G2L3Q9_9FLAO|nr:energy transducer TonB [Euzebyella marina]AYN66826.1 energy transducer TonB [Euzebyella marina]
MEPKKNQNVDINRNRNLYFLLSLLLVLAITLMAFEWKTYDKTYDYDISMNISDDLVEDVPITIHIKTPPPPPPIQAPPIIEIIEDDEEVMETEMASTETDQNEEVLQVTDVEVMEVDEPETIPFISIEEVPVFPGCEKEKDKRACFQEMMMKHIKKHFRYPEIAQEMGIEGRVSTMFVIEKDGTIGEIQMRGPDKTLEAEAKRILDKLPKMTPGKQRDRSVRVPFSIPITFQLQ